MAKIVWAGRYTPHHTNIRYKGLFPRLSGLTQVWVPVAVWKPFEAVLARLRLPLEKSPVWSILYRLLALRYPYMLVTSGEMHYMKHFKGRIIVDDDDPEFTPEHLAKLNALNVIAVVTTTDLLRVELLKHGLHKPCLVLPTGVDFSPLDPARTSEIRAAWDPPGAVVGFMSPRLFTDADLADPTGEMSLFSISYLSRVIDAVWKIHPQTSLYLIGRPSETVKAYAADHPQVKLLGYIPHSELLNHVAAFDLAVYPRTYDLKGRYTIKVMEFMACGVPVVATDVAETFHLADAGGGLLSASEEEFIQNTIRLIENPALRAELGEKGRTYAQAYTWGPLVVRYQQEVIDAYVK